MPRGSPFLRGGPRQEGVAPGTQRPMRAPPFILPLGETALSGTLSLSIFWGSLPSLAGRGLLEARRQVRKDAAQPHLARTTAGPARSPAELAPLQRERLCFSSVTSPWADICVTAPSPRSGPPQLSLKHREGEMLLTVLAGQ